MQALRLLVTVSVATLAWGLDPQLAITQYGHEVWTTANGLPQNSVRSIAQTPDGYLWIATMGGLARFDGVSFTTMGSFASGNPQTTPTDRVSVLATGPEGTLWIGTTGQGAFQLRGGKLSHVEGPLPNQNVRALCVDSTGTVWVGTERGLSKYQNGKLTTVFQGGNEWNVHAFLEYPAGVLWVGTNGGLKKLSGGSVTSYRTTDGLAGDQIWALAAAPDGGLWIGTRPGGLSLLRNGRFTNYTKRDGLTHNTIIALAEGRQGGLWIGTDGGGLNRFFNGHFTSYETREGLSNQVIRCLYEDQEGSLWLGTAGGGLNRFREHRFPVRSMREDLPSDVVHTVYQDRTGDVWLGTANGLGRIPAGGGKLIHYGSEDGLSSDLAWPVLRDRQGDLWVGCENGKLRWFRGADIRNPSARRTWQFSGGVRALFEQSDGSVWVSTTDALMRFRQGRMTALGASDGLNSPWVRAIAEAADGRLWIGTEGGIQEYRGGKFLPARRLSGTGSITDMYADRDGVLWILSSNNLARIDGDKTTFYTSAHGLPERDLYQLLEDSSRNFWIASHFGLLRIPRSELDAVARGTGKRLKLDIFGSAEGIQGSGDFSIGYVPAQCKLRDGTMWFPTYGGVLTVDPTKINSNLRPPPVYIERLAAGKRAAVPTGEEISAGANLEFHYTALSFLFPERVRFRYILQGFDSDWVDAGTRRVAYYTNLPPGSYRFRVIACNNDGVWNETGATLPLVLKPRYYQTFWFLLLCAAGVAGAGMAVYRWRVSELRQSERLLTQRVEERTAALRLEVQERKRAEEAAQAANVCKSQFLANMSHEIRTPMNGIMGMTDLALSTGVAEDQRRYMESVKGCADSLLALINEILDFSKIEAGKMDLESVEFSLRDSIPGALQLLAVRAAQKGVELICDIPPDVPDLLIGDPGRLRQVIVNLAGNAVKFTEEGEVLVRLAVEQAEEQSVTLRFSVSDTGIGVPAEKQQVVFQPFEQADGSMSRRFGGTGLGLAISARLAGHMGGRIWLESPAPNRSSPHGGPGSCFHFTAKFATGAVPRPHTQAAPFAGHAILVVEDNATNATVLRQQLESWGMVPTVVESGRDALDALDSAKREGRAFRVAIVDHSLPDTDTAALARGIKLHPDGGSIGLILLDTTSIQRDEQRTTNRGAEIHLLKPPKDSDLRQAIAAALVPEGRGAEETPSKAASSPGPLVVSRKLHILVAEDNPVNQKVAMLLLQKQGHSVELAGDGEQALAALDRREFDLVLMDVQMPNMDGFEATAAIRRREKDTNRHLPIVALTAHAMKGDLERTLEAGMDGYVAKPIQVRELHEAIARLVPDAPAD